MTDLIGWLLDSSEFTPRANCGYGWTDGLRWLHAGSDILIGLAYIAIPLTLLFFVRRRGMPFTGLIWLFGAFILACGSTHLVEATMFQTPVYRLSGVLKAATAAVSWVTVVALIPAAPRVVRAVETLTGRRPDDERHGDCVSARERTRQYVVAILAAVLAILVRAALDPWLGGDHAYVLPLLAVVSVAWYGGLWPALLTLLLSMTAVVYLFVEPRYSAVVAGFSDQMATGLFLFAGVACAMLGEAQQQAKARAGRVLGAVMVKQAELEAEVARRERAEAELIRYAADLTAAQEQTAATLAQLDTFVMNAPLGMAFLDPQLRFVRINKHLADANGKPIASHVGRPLADVLPDMPAAAVEDFRTVLETGEPLTDRLVSGDGTLTGGGRVWQSSYYPVRAAGGPLLGVGVVTREIGRQLKAEQALRESEATLRAFYDNSPACMGVVEPTDDGDIVHVYDNPATCAFFGVEPGRTRGRRASELGAPRETTASWLARYRESERAGGPVRFDHQFDTPGGPRWMAVTVCPLNAPFPRPRFCYLSEDITDRRRAEHALRESEERLRFLDALGEATRSRSDAEGVMAVITRMLGEHLRASRCAYADVDPDGDRFAIRHDWTDGVPSSVGAYSLDQFGPRVAADMRAGRTLVLRNVDADLAADGGPGAFAAIGIQAIVCCPLVVGGRLAAMMAVHQSAPRAWTAAEVALVQTVVERSWAYIERVRAAAVLRDEMAVTEALNRVGSTLAAELDLGRIVQAVTDEATRLTAAQFGAFFYNVTDDRGERYTLYTLSGVPREAFAKFPMPRNTAVFEPTFTGKGVVRLDDVTRDPRFGRNAPYHGMPDGHLPVRSYLAVPVASRSGEVIGGLFFGHPAVGAFTERHERFVTGVAAQAAIAIDNARLYEATRRSEARFRGLADRLAVAMEAGGLGDWEWDAATDVVTLSDRAADIFGIPPGPHLTWAAMQEMLPEEDRESTRLKVEQSVAWQTSYVAEYRVNRADGTQVWVAATGRGRYADDGTPLGMAGVIQDVTARKQQEQTVRESEGRFRALAEAVPQIVWVTRPDGYHEYYNPQWYDYTGMTEEESIGFGWSRPLHPDDAARSQARWKQSTDTGDTYEVEYRFRGKDGAYRWFLARAQPLRDESGAVVRWFGTCTDIDEFRRLRDQLRASEQRHRQLTEGIPQLVWTCRPDGMCDYLSRQWVEYTGVPMDDQLGLEWLDRVIHPDDRDRTTECWDLAVAGRADYDLEYRIRRHDGVYRWFQARGTPVRDAAGAITQWFGTCTDIDDRKRVEDTIAEQARLAGLRADVGLALAGEDADHGEVRAVLQRCAEAVVTHLDVAFARVWTLDEGSDTLELRASAGLYTHTDGPHGRVKVGEFKIGRIAQSRQPHLTNDVPSDPNVSDQEWAKREGMVAFAGYPLVIEGRVLGVVALFARRQLTPALLGDLRPLVEGIAQYLERRRTEAALRASEARFRLLTEAIPQVVWNARADGEMTYFNTRWQDVTGVPVEDARGSGWMAAVHPDDAGRVYAAWRATVTTQAADFTHELRLRRAADGRYRWFLAVAVPLRRADGAVDQWIGSMADIHDQKEQAVVLERMVAERTALLSAANAKLTEEVDERRKAEEKVSATAAELSRSNGELEKFAYVASHDLQEPLRKIQAFGDRLASRFGGTLGDQGKDYLDRMQASAARMRQLINDLLAFSRVTSKTQPFTAVDLNRTAADAVDDLHDRIQQSEGVVDVGPLPTIDADPTQMRQLVQNLIGNALKFRKPGETPRVTVRGEVSEVRSGDAGTPREVLRLTVADNGIGFEEKYLDRIFQVFQRLHGRQEYEGTGVGLAICRKIADRHGGEITARSTPGHGATFVVTLPVRQPSRGTP